MEPMTKENAFEILKQVAYAHVGNRQTHLAIEQALIVLQRLVTSPSDEKIPEISTEKLLYKSEPKKN